MMASKFLASTILFSSAALFATQNVTSDTTLDTAIITFANTGADTTINFQNSITLTPSIAPLLRPLNTSDMFTPVANSITVLGNNFSLNGGGAFRGFFVQGGTIAIHDLTLTNLKAKGGDGSVASQGGGGGGGAGLGGALYVGTSATVNLFNVSFLNSNATGGAGGTVNNLQNTGAGGGGGGLTGNGGVTPFLGGSAPGGGGFAFSGGNPTDQAGGDNAGGGGATGSVGGNANSTDGGIGGSDFAGTPGGAGGAGAGTGGAGGNGGTSGTGGGGGGSGVGVDGGKGGDGAAGGGGGGGAITSTSGQISGNGGAGGTFGGGGGGGDGNGSGGAGGFAGGGGGGGLSNTIVSPIGNGGGGGFGGGGGGGGWINSGTGGTGGTGGFGGGSGGTGNTISGGGGGGGAGFGGALFIENGAVVNINESATFQGNTVVAGTSGGTGATAASAAGADIFMMSGGLITFNITSNVTIPNAIAGEQGVPTGGGLTKSGSAMLSINGANTYTGTTTVSAGTLRINGSILTDVTNDATVTGSFSTPGIFTNNQILAPGNNGVGQATLGTLTSAAGSTLQFVITPHSVPPNNVLHVGTGTLDGDLQVFLNNGNYIKGTQYTVVTGPTTGTVTLVKTGPAASFVDLAVSYNNLVLTVLQHSIFNHQMINPGVPTAVADCIINADIVTNSDFANVVTILGRLSSPVLNQALYAMSPVVYGTLDWINARDYSLIARILSERLFELRCNPCQRINFWLDGYGAVANNKRHFDNLPRYRNETAGGIAGLDIYLCSSFNFGIAGGYTYDWIHWKNELGSGNNKTPYVAAYGSFRGCNLDLDFSVIAGKSDYQLTRKIIFEEATLPPILFDRKARSHPDAYSATGHLGLGWKAHWCGKILEPFALADFHHFRRKGFTEHGADSIDLHVLGHNFNMMRGEAGIRLYRIWQNCSSYSAPYLSLSWVGDYSLGKIHERASFVDQSCVIDVVSSHSPIQFISPQAGMKWTNDCGFSFSMNYKGYFNKKTIINEADIRFDWAF